MTVSMIANKRMSYATRMLKAGDPFEAKPIHARLFAKVGRARLADPAKVKTAEPLKVPPHGGLVMARAEYERVFGKRPHMAWNEAALREKIAAGPSRSEQRQNAVGGFFKADKAE